MILKANSKYNVKEILLILIPFLVFYKFFYFKPIVEFILYDKVLVILNLLFFVLIIPSLNRKYNRQSISPNVRNVLLILILSFIPALIVSNQSIYYGLRGASYTLLLCIYFWFLYHKISSRSVVQAFIIILVLYIVFHIISLLTFPNHIFGYNDVLIERAESDIEHRGVMRIGVPGQDFVILAIFAVLNLRYVNKKYLWLLVPLFVMLVLRGTRTPLFITIIISIIYWVWSYKYKIVFIIFCGIFYCSMPIIYESIKESNSDNIFVNYVKITDEQINSEDEDIRVEMSKYYLFDFNDNFIATLIGNGIPQGKSNYNQRICNNMEKGYYLSDVGYIQIFIYYGLIGICVYIFLFIKILKTKVSRNFEFAKLFVVYYFFVSLTGIYIIQNAFYMAFGLYLMEKNRLDKRSFRNFHKLE